MSVFLRKRKEIKECDMSGTCGGDGGMTAPSGLVFGNAATNIGGMGNSVPPTENSLGSGDNFGGVIGKVSTQKTSPNMKSRYKVRKKKK